MISWRDIGTSVTVIGAAGIMATRGRLFFALFFGVMFLGLALMEAGNI